MYAHRESFELYRRAIANVPDDLDPIELGALYEAYSDEAGAIDDSEAAEAASLQAIAAYRAAGEPAKALIMGTQISVLWRREARSIEDRARQLEQLEAELEALPPGPDRDAAAACDHRGPRHARARLDGPDRRAADGSNERAPTPSRAVTMRRSSASKPVWGCSRSSRDTSMRG